MWPDPPTSFSRRGSCVFLGQRRNALGCPGSLLLCAISPLPFLALRKNCTENAPHPGKIREKGGICPPFRTVWGILLLQEAAVVVAPLALPGDPVRPVQAERPLRVLSYSHHRRGSRLRSIFLRIRDTFLSEGGAKPSQSLGGGLLAWWALAPGPPCPSPGAGMQSRCLRSLCAPIVPGRRIGGTKSRPRRGHDTTQHHFYSPSALGLEVAHIHCRPPTILCMGSSTPHRCSAPTRRGSVATPRDMRTPAPAATGRAAAAGKQKAAVVVAHNDCPRPGEGPSYPRLQPGGKTIIIEPSSHRQRGCGLCNAPHRYHHIIRCRILST